MNLPSQQDSLLDLYNRNKKIGIEIKEIVRSLKENLYNKEEWELLLLAIDLFDLQKTTLNIKENIQNVLDNFESIELEKISGHIFTMIDSLLFDIFSSYEKQIHKIKHPSNFEIMPETKPKSKKR
jgi:hypothetical protein